MDRPEETSRQRRERYLRVAAEVEAAAARAKDPETRKYFITIAKPWRRLAEHLQAKGESGN